MTATLIDEPFQTETGWWCSLSIDYGASKPFVGSYRFALEPDDAMLQATGRSELARLSAAQPTPGKRTIRAGQQIDLTPPIQPQPSAEDKARTEYYAARGIYSRMLEDARLGERKADDADVLAAQQNMAALRKPEYL